MSGKGKKNEGKLMALDMVNGMTYIGKLFRGYGPQYEETKLKEVVATPTLGHYELGSGSIVDPAEHYKSVYEEVTKKEEAAGKLQDIFIDWKHIVAKWLLE